MKSILIIFFAALLSAAPGAAGAEPYHPAGMIRLLSEYKEVVSAPPRQVEWEVRAEDAGRHWTLDFSPAGAQGTLCRLTLSHGEDALNIEWEGPDGREKTQFSGIMVLPGFPAPCDILPIGSGEGPFQVKREAGGHGFVKTYQVVRQQVNRQEAEDRGWIRAVTETQSPLYLVKLIDSSGATVLLQLWDPTAPWWLYEENGSRRSWLMGPLK